MYVLLYLSLVCSAAKFVNLLLAKILDSNGQARFQIFLSVLITSHWLFYGDINTYDYFM